MQNQIRTYFTESIQTQIVAAESLANSIEKAATILVNALLEGGKVLCCGNGVSAANAQIFTTKLINKFETERPSLPAIAISADNVMLTSIMSNDHNDEIYAKQISALGQSGDVLLAIYSNGCNNSVIKAIEVAVRRNMSIILLSNNNDEELSGLLSANDVTISVPSHQAHHIEEVHVLVLNCLCSLIDQLLFLQQYHEEEE